MKAFLIAYQKQIEIAFLLALLVGMDFAKITDVELKYTLMALLGALTGFRGAAAGFSGLASLMGGSQPAASAMGAQTLPPGTQVTISPPVPVLSTVASAVTIPPNAQP